MEPSLPKEARLRSRSDFKHIFDHGASASDKVLRVLGEPGKSNLTRAGFVVSRRWGNAPKRNRLRRILREGFRQVRLSLPAPFDLVLIPKRPDASPKQISESLVQLTEKLVHKLDKRNQAGTS